ncbi:MAG: hypothetical protein KAG94_03990 [Clostridiales bacterium]|nr:hypothetical protein [Clostridiales bacterium]
MMKKTFSKLWLNREARLFDSHLYILKGFLGVLIGYVLFETHSFIGRDMISLLFGMMLALEPVNTTGIKSGVTQIKASLVGGVCTALIVGIFGINFITVPIAMALTMYVSLLIDWKSILPVAMFTSIYMTQVIQYTAIGSPSMLITLQLRFLSLGAGVIIAIVLNYIFSLLFYKSMIRKRIIFLFEQTSLLIGRYIMHMRNHDVVQLKILKREMPLIFGDIDYVFGHITDLKSEKKKRQDIAVFSNVILEIRDLNHYHLDLVMSSLEEKDLKVVNDMVIVKEEVDRISKLLDKKEVFNEKDVCKLIKHETVHKMGDSLSKIYYQLLLLKKY